MRIAPNLRVRLPLLTIFAALLMACVPGQASAAQSFSTWVEKFWPTAKSAGITRATYDRAFKGMTPDPKVLEAANFQPEYVKPVGEYVDRVVSDKRIAMGKQMLEENKALLDVLEKKYGVDRTIIIAIWGVESNYGTQPGDMNVIRSLATLAYTGTKAKFARQQLISALKILQRGDISFELMNGSWAGAMGHTQFIPTTYQGYAVDHDG
ncbi:MAG: lytic murein transglycosylase, partial [Methyloceanibacter sp.]